MSDMINVNVGITASQTPADLRTSAPTGDHAQEYKVADSAQLAAASEDASMMKDAEALRKAALQTPTGSAHETLADKLLKDEAHYWAQAMPDLVDKWSGLDADGRDYALMALAKNPALAADISVYFARRALMNGLNCTNGAKDLERLNQCGSSPEQDKALGKELMRFTNFIVHEGKDSGVSPLYFNDLISPIADMLTARPQIFEQLNKTEQNRLMGLFKDYTSEALKSDRDFLREAVSDLTRAAVKINKETKGALDIDWVFDALGNSQDSSLMYIRRALESDRAIPDEVMNNALATMDTTVQKYHDSRNFFYSQDWFSNNLALIHDAFDARNDREGRDQFGQKLLGSAAFPEMKEFIEKYLLADKVTVEPTPDIRIKAGDARINITVGGSPSQAAPAAPAPVNVPPVNFKDPEETGNAIKDIVYWIHKDDEALAEAARARGDQAILALGDPELKDSLQPVWVEMLGHEHFGGMLARSAFGRLGQIRSTYPDRFESARAGFVDTLEQAIKKGGKGADDITFYLDSPALTKDDRMRLMNDELILQGAGKQDEYRTHKRGILFGALTDTLGTIPYREMPPQDVATIKESLGKMMDHVVSSFKERHDGLMEALDRKKQNP